jgi:hypothetical protein
MSYDGMLRMQKWRFKQTKKYEGRMVEILSYRKIETYVGKPSYFNAKKGFEKEGASQGT